MKITKLRHRIASVPVQYPVVSSVRQSAKIDFILLDVQTDEELTGIAYAQAFHIHGARAVQSCLNLLEAAVSGSDADDIEGIWGKMWKATKLLGHQGLSTFALSMVDIALWDLRGKQQHMPVYRMLGGTRDEVKTYMSDGLWLVSPLEAARQASGFAEQGFGSMKMRLGRKESTEDVRAAKEIRRAIGDQVRLLGDVNQGWTADQTLMMEQQLMPYQLGWLEEPIDAEDQEGYQQLTRKSRIPIATGENLYALRSFQRFLQAGAASVYTPDLQRIGGITGWMRIQPMLEHSQSLYSVHLFPEYAVHLLSAANTNSELEWMSWASALFQEPLVCREGKVYIPARAGFGMDWDEEKVNSFLVT